MTITAQDTKLKPGYKQTEVGVIPDDWEPTPLGLISAFITKGATPTTYGFNWVNEGVLFLRSECVSEQGLDLTQSMFITPEAHNILKRGEVRAGDILITITGNVGRVIYLSNDFGIANINQHIARIRIIDINVSADYVFHFLSQSTIRKYYGSIITGQAYPQISLKQVRETRVPIPPTKAEQKAIATALSDVDALITSLDRLIAKKRDIKQATMQQLLTGKTRLPGFSDEWKLKKVDEIFQFLNTANNSRSDLSENGEIKYIHYGDIHMKWRSFLDCSSGEIPLIERNKVGNVPFLEDGDLVMADASEDYEGIGISVEVKNATSRKVVAGLHTFLLRGDKEVLADGFKGYLQYIPAVKDSLRKAATGISVYGISKNNVKNLSICLPNITEQRAIATVFSDMDAEIAAWEQRRDKTRTLKQGMMQELLTGRTRLV